MFCLQAQKTSWRSDEGKCQRHPPQKWSHPKNGATKGKCLPHFCADFTCDIFGTQKVQDSLNVLKSHDQWDD